MVGLDDAQTRRTLATADDVAKLSVRDLAGGRRGRRRRRDHGGRAPSAIAAAAGIAVFATGGLGGVHRDARPTFDESADLTTLARTPIAVVCAGVKSILDVGATLERLETLGVGVRRLPHHALPRLLRHRQRLRPGLVGRHRPAQVAEILRAQREQDVQRRRR